MMINWDDVKPGSNTKLTRPREIFASLRDRKWSRLRPEQNEVLEKWYERRDETDLVLKQNTGGGKTLAGLLIAQSSLNESIGPAAYLVPDKFLIQQVVEEANNAKIAVTQHMDDEAFQSSEAILVTTFHKLLNGRSRFGVRGSGQARSLGTIIIDDAHSALAASKSIFSVFIPRAHDAYSQLLNLFKSDLKFQSPNGFADIEAGQYTAVIGVPASAIEQKAEEMMSIIHPHANNYDNASLVFPWKFVADLLEHSVVTFTSKGIEIKTPCPDIALIPAFHQAQRRVYLTATLADEGTLVTELDADPTSVSKPITPDQASDLGDRIILAPQSINPRLGIEGIYKLARDFADGDRDGDGRIDSTPINVVVLVPGEYRASKWKNVADRTLYVHDMRETIEQMKRGNHVGVVVLVNKYDGVDLPGDACRLLIIDGVPTPLTPHEQRAESALMNSQEFISKQVQRLEQGMGRGIRDVEDHCAVLVLTNEAALTLKDPQQRKFYSLATQAQIQLSSQIADQIRGVGHGTDYIAQVLNMFLNRQPEWVTKSLEATANVKYTGETTVTEFAKGRRKAFNLLLSGDRQRAFRELQRAIDSITSDLEKGWALEELAAFQHFVNPTAAQKTLATARQLNSSVLKPTIQTRYQKLSAPVAQARAAADYLSKYTDPSAMEMEIGKIFDNILWGVENTFNKSEEQFRLLGLHLGLGSTRPDKETDDGGPDNLWALAADQYAVIELKTEVTRADKRIIKDEAGQLTQSVEWFKAHYGDVRMTPVLVHPSTELAPDAYVGKGTRVITETHLAALRSDVQNFVRELSDSKNWGSEQAVRDSLSQNHLTAEQVIASHSKLIGK